MLPLTSFAIKGLLPELLQFFKILQFSELLPEFLHFKKICNFLNS